VSGGKKRNHRARVERQRFFGKDVVALKVFRRIKWALRSGDLDREPRQALVEGRAGDSQQSIAVEASVRRRDRALCERASGSEVDRARGIEVPVLREIRTFGHVNPVDGLGDQEVEIREPLTMTMARHIERNTVDEQGHVGAVVGVKAAKK